MMVNTSFKLVLAPHEIDTKHLTQIVQIFQGCQPVLYSNAALNDTLSTARVLIIDNIGMLNTLYSYASIAYIGGGFGKGIHNVLEAIAYKIPVVFGPNYSKFKEARDLIKLEVAFSIKNKEQLEMILQQLPSKHQNPTLSELIEAYLETNRGATNMITKSLQKHFKE
jgi:3-deoxy-D-manno-octulosonic-acid transferase